MSGQSAMKTVKEVKSTIKGIECNHQMSSGGDDKEMSKQTGHKKIGSK